MSDAMRIPTVVKSLKASAAGVDVRSRRTSGSDRIADPKEQAKLKRATQDFESIFVNFMLREMRATIPKSGLMGDGHGEDIYRSMLDEEVSKQVARGGGLGLASALYQQLGKQK